MAESKNRLWNRRWKPEGNQARKFGLIISLFLSLIFNVANAQTQYCLTNLIAREKQVSVTLTWTHDGSSLYKIYRSTVGTGSGFSQIGTTNSTYSTYLDNTVAVNQMYYYYVQSINSCVSPVVSVMPRVRAKNSPPSITSSPVTQIMEYNNYQYQVAATDPDGNALNYYLDVAPQGMTISASGLIQWSPKRPNVGSNWVGIRATDGYLCCVQYFQVNVTKEPDFPVISFITPVKNSTITTNTPYIKITWSDATSGINASSAKIVLNSIEATQLFTLTKDSAIYQVPATGFLPEGANKIIVTVTDNTANTTTDSLTFTVQLIKLQALPQAIPDSGVGPLTVRFKTAGRCSYSTINWYRWDFEGDGTWNNSTQVAQDYTFTYNNPGVYFAALQVENMLGEKETEKVRIVVTGPPPVATATATPSNGAAPLTVTFTGSGQKTNGTIVQYEWDLNGDGVFEKIFPSDLYHTSFESQSSWTTDSRKGPTDAWKFSTAPATPNWVWSTNDGSVQSYGVGHMSLITPDSIFIPSADRCTLSFKQTFFGGGGATGLKVNILMWYPSGGAYTTAIIQALNNFVPSYSIAYSTATSGTSLQQDITGKDVLIIPYFYNSVSTGVGTAFAPILNSFIAKGGIVIIAFPYYYNNSPGFINETGLFNITYQNYYYYNTNMQIMQPTDPLFKDISNPAPTGDYTSYFTINDNSTILAQYSGYTTIAEKKIGSGAAYILGNLFYTYWDNWGRMLANAVKMSKKSQGIVYAGSGKGFDSLYAITNSVMDSVVKIDFSSYMGQKILLKFDYSGSGGAGINDRWDIDDIVLTATSSGKSNTFFIDNATGNVTWNRSTVDGHQWARRPDTLWTPHYADLEPGLNVFPDTLDAFLISPTVQLSGKTIGLSYEQRFSSVKGLDGGWLEISQNGAAFAKIAPTSGYPGTLTPAYGGYPANSPAFTGALGDASVSFDLSSYTGSQVQLRFRFASNSPVNRRQWKIDDFKILVKEQNSPSTVTTIYSAPGTYNAVFRITDNEGQTATANAIATAIEVGPPGTPTVTSTVSPASGKAPLSVNFTATATAPNSTIALYEWDFDGDGVFDWSSKTTGNTSHSYNQGGQFIATVRVTNAVGMTSFERHLISVDVNASLAINDADRTFNPYNSETMAIQTTLSGQVPATVYLKDKTGQIVRTLVDWTTRAGGTYNDIWDGRDNNGNLLGQGAYYAILDYKLGNEIHTIDLTNSTGGQAYNPQRSANYNFVINPYNNVQLPISFTLARPSEATLFMGVLSAGDIRLRTLLNRVPLGAGSYTIYWDGLTDDGHVPYQHSGDIIPGLWGYYLPDNAVWVQNTVPAITNLSTSPTIFAPMDEACGPSGEKNGLNLTYSLSANAPVVTMRVYNADNGQMLFENSWNNINAGSHTIFWNGRNSDKKALDIGAFRIGFCASDQYGNQSIWRYNLLRTLYAFQPTEGEK